MPEEQINMVSRGPSSIVIPSADRSSYNPGCHLQPMNSKYLYGLRSRPDTAAFPLLLEAGFLVLNPVRCFDAMKYLAFASS